MSSERGCSRSSVPQGSSAELKRSLVRYGTSERPGTSGMLGAARTVSALDLHFMVRNQARLAGDYLHMVGIIEQALVLVGAVFLNDLILLGHQLRPTERHVDRGEARILWVGGIVDQAGRLDQVLGRGTTPVCAATPDRAKF